MFSVSSAGAGHFRGRRSQTALGISCLLLVAWLAPMAPAQSLEVPVGATLRAGDTLYVRVHLVPVVPDPFNAVQIELRPSADLTFQNVTITLFDDGDQPLGSSTSNFGGSGLRATFVEPGVSLDGFRNGLPAMASIRLNRGADIHVQDIVWSLGFTSPEGGFMTPLIGGTSSYAINELPPPPAPLPPEPLVITRNTRLTGDYYGNIVIGADSISLDCAGYEITGVQHGAGVLLEGRTGVRVMRCTVTDFQQGFRLVDSDRNRISHSSAHGNRVGFDVGDSSRNSLRHNMASSNRDTGFTVSGASAGNWITASEAVDNRGAGFMIDRSSHNLLRGNLSMDNRDGFVVDDADANTIKNNHATGNSRYGFLAAETDDNLFTGNRACGNLELDAHQFGGENVFEKNRFCTAEGL